MSQEITTTVKQASSLMKRQENYIGAIAGGMQNIIGKSDDYQRLCGYNVLSQINFLLSKEGMDHGSQGIDKESINNAIKFAMVYGLNTDNKEIFVILRNTKVNGKFVKTVECKPQYLGTLKIISDYGKNVKKVFPTWFVREEDEFTYPTRKGIELIDPTWVMKNASGKVARAVVPIQFTDGSVEYFIAERESVAANIKAQIKQSVMFDSKKDYYLRLINEMTLDELLSCDELKPLINDTYTGISSEEMIKTKLVLNAVKRVAIDFSNAFSRELYEKTYDNADVYVKNHNAQQILEQQQTLVECQDDDIKEVSNEDEPAAPVEKSVEPATADNQELEQISDKDMNELFGE